MTENTFAVISNILSAMPSQQPWDDRVSMVYAIALQRWDDELAQRATTHALMTKKFRPTPAELREIALSIKRVKVPTGQASSQIKHIVLYHPEGERSKVAQRMVRDGKISPIIPDVVKSVGGWGRVGSMTESQLNDAIERAIPEVQENPDVDAVLETPIPMIDGRAPKMIGE
jgi:hypothetical protein